MNKISVNRLPSKIGRLSINFGASRFNGIKLYITVNCNDPEIISSFVRTIKEIIINKKIDMKHTYDIHLFCDRQLLTEYRTFRIKCDLISCGDEYNSKYHQTRLLVENPSELYRPDNFEENMDPILVTQPSSVDVEDDNMNDMTLSSTLRMILKLDKPNIKKFEILVRLLRKEIEFKRKYYHFWQDSRSLRTHKKIQYGLLYNVKVRQPWNDMMLHKSFRSKMTQEIISKYSEQHDKRENVVDLLYHGIELRIRDRYVGAITNLTKLNGDLLKMMFIENTHFQTTKLLSGRERQIYGALINLYRMKPFNTDFIYYCYTHRSYILFQKIDEVYHEIDTLRFRHVVLFETFEKHMNKISCFIRRTKRSMRPYGHLFKKLCQIENIESMPQISSYRDLANYSVDDLKKWFWVKIYNQKDKRNSASHQVRIIRDPCWSYYKIRRCDHYLFGFGPSSFSLDKSMRK